MAGMIAEPGKWGQTVFYRLMDSRSVSPIRARHAAGTPAADA